MNDRVKIAEKTIFWHTGRVIDETGETKLEPLPMAFLKFLVEHQGQVVSKEELLQNVWKNKQVTDDAIRRVVKLVRNALGDDAKSPKFIKTLPSQGYMFVAEVESEPKLTTAPQTLNLVQQFLSINSKALLFLVGVVLLTLALVSTLPISPSNKNEPFPTIAKLTSLDGSETKGDYCASSNTLLFSYKPSASAPQALYSKNLTSNEIKRLSHTKGEVHTPLYSPNCSKIAYMLKTGNQFESYTANLTPSGLINVTKVSTANANRELQSWSADGSKLYFSGAGLNASKTNSAVITSFDLANQRWQQNTFSLVEGRGDLIAKESQDGRYLAILRNREAYRVSLLILDLVSNSIITEQLLGFYPSHLIWLNGSEKRVAISSRKGDLAYFDVLKEELTEQSNTLFTLNDVFFHCDQQCFFMRQYDMNYSDIKELPNPFENQAHVSTIHIESNAADFNPVYGPDGTNIYFTKTQSSMTQLLRRNAEGQEETLLSYGPKRAIHNLQIGPNEKFATGKLDNRIFLLDIKSKNVSFISTEQEQAFFPLFSQDGSRIFFARTEQDKLVLQEYDIQTGITEKQDAGLLARYEDNQGNTFLLDSEYRLYKMSNQESQFLVQLGDNPYYHWQISGNYVYFSNASGADVYLNRLNIKTKQIETKLLFNNSKSYHFSLHPNKLRLLVAEALLPESDLVKVTWN